MGKVLMLNYNPQDDIRKCKEQIVEFLNRINSILKDKETNALGDSLSSELSLAIKKNDNTILKINNADTKKPNIWISLRGITSALFDYISDISTINNNSELITIYEIRVSIYLGNLISNGIDGENEKYICGLCENGKQLLQKSTSKIVTDARKEYYYFGLFKEVEKYYDFNSTCEEVREFLISLVEDAVTSFMALKEDKVFDYFKRVLISCQEHGIFDNFARILVLEDAKKYKLYYFIVENINEFLKFTYNYSNIYNVRVLREKLTKLVESIRVGNSTNDVIFLLINKLYAKIDGLIVSITPEKKSELGNSRLRYYSNDLEVNTINDFIDYLLDMSLNSEKYGDNPTITKRVNGIDLTFSIDDFDTLWSIVRYNIVKNKLCSIYERNGVPFKKSDFNEKYSSKVMKMIDYISCHDCYINGYINELIFTSDFNMVLNLLHRVMVLEEKIKSMQLDEILCDIDNIDYRYYDKVLEYVDKLSSIIDSNDTTDIMNRYKFIRGNLFKKRRKRNKSFSFFENMIKLIIDREGLI